MRRRSWFALPPFHNGPDCYGLTIPDYTVPGTLNRAEVVPLELGALLGRHTCSAHKTAIPTFQSPTNQDNKGAAK